MKTIVYKRHLKKIMILLTCIVIYSSCTKEGDVGPIGLPGEKGDPGPQGTAGEDGSIIFAGSAIPGANLGSLGDYYFRTSTSDFYGPKMATGWGTPTNLKGATGSNGATGATGATGAPGSKILTGTIVPAVSNGNIGDYYFRSTTGDFYGPKTTNGWGIPINLKGVKGADGTRIFSGTTVPSTTLGNVGDFYFRTTTSEFYGPKTASSWGTPTSLKGATGATGATGAAGSKIISGIDLPTLAIGAVGDYYLHSTTANLYGPKTATSWGSPISLRGPAGPQTNVIYSKWMSISGFSTTSFTGYLLCPEIQKDPNLLNTASIAVYAKEFNGNFDQIGIYQLNSKTAFWGLTLQYYIDTKYNEIVIKTDGLPKISMQDAYLFRYVIIPGNKEAENIQQASIPRNYNELKLKFNIPD